MLHQHKTQWHEEISNYKHSKATCVELIALLEGEIDSTAHSNYAQKNEHENLEFICI